MSVAMATDIGGHRGTPDFLFSNPGFEAQPASGANRSTTFPSGSLTWA